MDSIATSAVGPVFGPDFLVIVATDDNNQQYHLEVYPDYNNPNLKLNGIPTQYYFVPQRVYLAKKQDSPQDFDFGMTVFKGLMTSEDTVGVTAAMMTAASGGELDKGGGFCTFSTTFAIPDTVVANALKALKARQFANPIPARLAQYVNHDPEGPHPPLLGIVPILSNDVTIEVPQFGTTDAGTSAPMIISAQGTGKGSTEASGISAFLVTCNEMAAGAIAGSLKAGVSPFTVHYNMSEQFYLPACEVDVDIDMDKTYASFSAAVTGGGLFDSFSFQGAWANTVTTGGITTNMRMNDAQVPADLRTWILQNVQQMQQQAMDLVKSQIFDWKPTDGGAATAPPSTLLGSIFGGCSVGIKANYQKTSIHTKNTFNLDTTIAVSDTKSGDLSDLLPAIKAHLDTYLAVVDIGDFFQKLQVAVTNSVNWAEQLPDGTSLADPLSSVMVEVGYPDYTTPLGADGKPNLKTLGQGFHYQVGSTTGQSSLAQWNSTNPHDVVNLSFLRLDKPVKQWPADQVTVTKTLVFDGNDPRVDLKNNQTTVKITTTGTDHTPVITAAEVGYFFTRFMVRPLPPNITLTVTTTLGARNDTFTITSANQKNVIFELFSDKYIAETVFKYSVQVTVNGPDFTDNPIVYASPAPVQVALPPGRAKWINLVNLQLPDAPAAQVAAINDYIKRYLATPQPTT